MGARISSTDEGVNPAGEHEYAYRGPVSGQDVYKRQGTYTLDDSTLVFRPLVSMNPNNMRGRPFQSIRTEWAGDDIWLIYTGAEGVQNRCLLYTSRCV